MTETLKSRKKTGVPGIALIDQKIHSVEEAVAAIETLI